MSKKLIYLFSFVFVLALVGNAAGQLATNPIPPNGGEIDQAWVALGWTAGAGAVSHNLYLGNNFADVRDGTGGTFRVNQAQPLVTFLAGFPGYPYPEGLVPGTTYYWRVDEVLANGTVITGQVWSFTFIGPAARNPRPLEGARFVNLDAQLSWSAGAGAIMHHVYFGNNRADVDAGTGGTDKGIATATTFAPGRLVSGTTYYWRVDEFDGFTTHKGDIWSFKTKPVFTVLDPNLVGWWKLDNEGTGTAIDYSGNNRDGSLHGNPQWVPGADGDALEFDGDDYVLIDGYKGVVGDGTNTPAWSVTAWVRCTAAAAGEVVGWGSTGGGNRMEFRINSNRTRAEGGNGNTQGDTNMNDGQWHHIAMTVAPNSVYMSGLNLYLDGQLDTRANSDPDPFHPVANFDVIFGYRYNRDNTRWFTGALDDVRIYDKELTLEEIGRAMIGDPRLAWNPSPADEAEPFVEEAVLIWTPGDTAAKHDVYLGISEMVVLDADASDTTGIYRGRQDANSYTPTETLEFGETYYWRIDEIEADGTTIHTGRILSFTIASFIVVDDFESYNDLDTTTPGSKRIFLTWIDGYGIPTNGSIVGYNVSPFAETGTVHWGNQAMPYFYDNSVGSSEATMTLSSVRDWTKHGVKALSLWFQGYPVSVGSFTQGPGGTYTLAARSIGNISGQSDEFHFAYQQLTGAGSITVKVNWVRDADDNAQAGVMIRSTLDPNSVHAAVLLETGDLATEPEISFDRRSIKGEGTTSTPTAGIMAPQWLKIQRDMAGIVTASYSADGVTWTQLGSEPINMNTPMYIGLVVASEAANVTCEAEFSSVQITGAAGQWANQDIGILSNDPEPMYVAIANSGRTPAVVYHDDPDATRINEWTEWNIDLKAFANKGVNLTNVNTISIGFGNKANPQPGGSGKMYFDDIRLYRPRCMLELLQPAGDFNNDCLVDCLDLAVMAADWLRGDSVVATTAPDPAGLMAYYKFDGNATDSSGNNHHGMEKGGPTYVPGKFGQAIHLDGFDDYIAIQTMNYTGTNYPEVTVCTWVRTSDEEGQIASFDRSENWRLEIGGQYAGGDGLVGWEVYTSTGQIDTGPNGPGNTRRVDDGQWHHVAGVFSNGTLTIYVDGNPLSPYFGGATFGQGRYTRYGFLGCHSEASYPPPTGRQTGAYFEGDLDDVRIYHRTLSQNEIRYLADETPDDGELYVPVPSVANISNEEAPLSKLVSFKDFALLADGWLNEQLWPAP